MTGISTSRNDTLALHRTVPTQAPIALRREMALVRALHNRCASDNAVHSDRRQHRPVGTRPIAIIHNNATAQIAIAYRLC